MNNYTGMAKQRQDREQRTEDAWAQREANLFARTGFYANQQHRPMSKLGAELFNLGANAAKAQAKAAEESKYLTRV